jgi:hypothetical protein
MEWDVWVQQYQGELLSRTGLSLEDGPMESTLRSFFDNEETPSEAVSWVIDKHDLDDLRVEAYERDTYNRFREEALARFGYAPPARRF